MAGKLWKKVRDEAGKSNLEEIDLAQFEVERPTVVYLSGFLTTNKRTGFIAGSIKKLQNLLENGPEDSVMPDVYAWSHGGISNVFNLAVYDTFPHTRSSEAGYRLSTGLLMPLVAENFKRHPDGSVEGTPRPVEDAAPRLRNLTLFGYSAGSIVAQETFNATLDMMQKIGYREQDARKLLKEVVLLAVGSISRPTKETDRFTAVTLVASNDRINRFKNWLWGTLGTLRRTFTTNYTVQKKTKPLSIRPLSNASLFVSTAVRSSLHEYVADDKGNRTKKPFMPLYPKLAVRRSYHELPHYVTTDPQNNGFAHIAFNALSNAVNRDSTPDSQGLLQPVAGSVFSEDEKQAYRERIAEAMQPMPKKLIVKKLTNPRI